MSKFFRERSVEKRSREFIASLDRSVLGNFACDEYALGLMDVTYRFAASYGRVPKISSRSGYYAKFDELIDIAGVNTDMSIALRSEILFWWMKMKDIDMQTYHDTTFGHIEKDVVNRRASELKVISQHPDMHAYFAMDIWDVEFIERCIADDVDAELAVSIRVSP